MKKVYILGAGASKADGLPMQAELFKYIFEFKMSNMEKQENFMNMHVEHYSSDINVAYERFIESRKQLAVFLLENFGNDTQSKFASDMRMHLDDKQRSLGEQLLVENMWEHLLKEARKVNVTLEDVFTVLDKAVIERKHFTSYSNDSIRMIRKELQQCIIFILSCQMERLEGTVNYEHICEQILSERVMTEAREDNLAVITLNWDTLFERKLLEVCEAWNMLYKDRKVKPDLCFYDYTFGKNEQRIPSTLVKSKGYYNIKLLKLHGSLNWLMCPKCGKVYVDYKRNIALKELGTLEKEEQYCRICTKEMIDGERPQLESFIITPTYFKELDNLHLQNIWYNAYIDLTEADEIVFIGYSLPDADFELKNLLKRSIRRKAKITVVLRKEDNPEYYEAILRENGVSMEVAKQMVSKMSFPCQRYSSLLSGNKINFYYEGLEAYFKETKHD